MNDIIVIKNLVKTYKTETDVRVLQGIDLSIKRESIVSITGESGSGKTTLLNLIGGIDKITSGEIFVEDKAIHKMNESELARFRNTGVGYIFQFHNLLNEFTSLENVMIPFLIKRYDKRAALKKAEELLKEVGLSERLHHKIGEISGGEAQRVAIARALINEPSVILADEPTGNLDKKNALMVRELLWRLTKERKSTLIIVTHSNTIAKAADRMMRIEDGARLIEA